VVEYQPSGIPGTETFAVSWSAMNLSSLYTILVLLKFDDFSHRPFL
jgi:hypothetical protein